MEQSGYDVYARTLERVAELCGGADRLAARLRVSTRQLEAWTLGVERTPRAIFLEVVDMLMEDSLGTLRSRPKSPEEDARP